MTTVKSEHWRDFPSTGLSKWLSNKSRIKPSILCTFVDRSCQCTCHVFLLNRGYHLSGVRYCTLVRFLLHVWSPARLQNVQVGGMRDGTLAATIERRCHLSRTTQPSALCPRPRELRRLHRADGLPPAAKRPGLLFKRPTFHVLLLGTVRVSVGMASFRLQPRKPPSLLFPTP